MYKNKKHKYAEMLICIPSIFIACFVFEKYKRYKKRIIEIGVQGF